MATHPAAGLSALPCVPYSKQACYDVGLESASAGCSGSEEAAFTCFPLGEQGGSPLSCNENLLDHCHGTSPLARNASVEAPRPALAVAQEQAQLIQGLRCDASRPGLHCVHGCPPQPRSAARAVHPGAPRFEKRRQGPNCARPPRRHPPPPPPPRHPGAAPCPSLAVHMPCAGQGVPAGAALHRPSHAAAGQGCPSPSLLPPRLPPRAPAPRRHQQEREQRLAPTYGYIETRHGTKQCGTESQTPGMRLIVTSWMVEVAAAVQLQDETLHLAVQLFDRLLSSLQVRRRPRRRRA